MATNPNTDSLGTTIKHKRNINFNQIVHNYYAVPIFIMKSRFLGLCVLHTCLVGLAPMLLKLKQLQLHVYLPRKHVWYLHLKFTLILVLLWMVG